jgi:hypothetical protein
MIDHASVRDVSIAPAARKVTEMNTVLTMEVTITK